MAGQNDHDLEWPERTAPSPRRRRVLGGLGSLAALVALPVPVARSQQGSVAALGARRPPAALVQPPAPIEVVSRPLAGFGKAAGVGGNGGRLEFTGGMVLTSPVKAFGGWSGAVVSEDGRRLLAVSDQGSWMTADIQYDGSRPKALASAVLGDIAGIGGQLLARGRDRDAESITLLDGSLSRGTVLIAFERNHRIGRFPVTDRGLGAPLGYLRMPPEARRMSTNKGLEAVTVLRGGPLRGAVVAFAEEFYDAQRNHTGWIWPAGTASEPQRLSVVNIADYALTDVASLPDGSLLLLERKFRWLEGVRCRIRQIRAGDVRPGARLDGDVLLDADMTAEIDNMEALALSRNDRGQTVLTLMSDNNFNAFLQRTLLLQFVLIDAPRAGRS